MSNKVFTPENISKLNRTRSLYSAVIRPVTTLAAQLVSRSRSSARSWGTARAYRASPTLSLRSMNRWDKVSTEELTRSVRRFADYTRYNTDKVFYVTKIGCGIAGFSVEEIVEVFKSVSFGDNVVLPARVRRRKNISMDLKGVQCRYDLPGLQIRGGQETYEEDVELKVCNRGFHFCESPFSVLSYRDMLDDECKFIPVHHVTALGRCHSDSDKTATTKIHIGAKLDFKGFIKSWYRFHLREVHQRGSDRQC